MGKLKDITYFAVKKKKKSKVVPVYTMKAYSGRRAIAQLIFNISTKTDLNGKIHAPATTPPPPQKKKPRYPLNRMLGGRQSRLGAIKKRKISCS
jgi:hypothetical protein